MIKRNSLKEFWSYRQVAINFFLRDYKVFYRDAFLGFLWTLIQPLSIMFVFYFLFHKVVGFQVDSKVPYTLILLSGVVLSQFFAGSVGSSMTSLKDNIALMQRVYIPKYIPALARTMYNSIDFLIMTIILIIFSSFFEILSWKAVYLPFIIFFSFFLLVFFSIIISILVALFKDIRFVVEFVLRLVFFISPVGYTYQSIPEKYQKIAALNPLFPMIHLFRWSFFGESYGELNLFFLFAFVLWIVVLFFLALLLLRTVGDSILD